MIRVSFGIYNTEEEVDKFIEILAKTVEATKNNSLLMSDPEAVPEY